MLGPSLCCRQNSEYPPWDWDMYQNTENFAKLKRIQKIHSFDGFDILLNAEFAPLYVYILSV